MLYFKQNFDYPPQGDMIENQTVDSISVLNKLLKHNYFFANGKNFPITHLYETSANSRWPYENLWGIYLTKPHFAWMALWMAVTSRASLKKRHVKYFSPARVLGDHIGGISIFNPDALELKDILCEKAYLYFFDPLFLQNLPCINLSEVKSAAEKIAELTKNSFDQRTFAKREKNYTAYVNSSNENLVVDIDDWQVAVINVEKLVPVIEIMLTGKIIGELGNKIEWLKKEVEENYIVK